MPGASRLDRRNERHPAFFMPVWPDPGGGPCHDADPCHGGNAGSLIGSQRTDELTGLLNRLRHGIKVAGNNRQLSFSQIISMGMSSEKPYSSNQLPLSMIVGRPLMVYLFSFLCPCTSRFTFLLCSGKANNTNLPWFFQMNNS